MSKCIFPMIQRNMFLNTPGILVLLDLVIPWQLLNHSHQQTEASQLTMTKRFLELCIIHMTAISLLSPSQGKERFISSTKIMYTASLLLTEEELDFRMILKELQSRILVQRLFISLMKEREKYGNMITQLVED